MFCLELIKFVTNYISGFVTSLISSHKLDLICSQIPVQQVLPYTTSERKKKLYIKSVLVLSPSLLWHWLIYPNVFTCSVSHLD